MSVRALINNLEELSFVACPPFQFLRTSPLNTASIFNSTVLKFHDFSESTNREGFYITLQQNQLKILC